MATTFDPTTADHGEITTVAPADIIIDPNVRREVRKDASFVSSIRTRGFIQYPVGWRDEDGRVHITVGQRRINAALEIGWAQIPVVLKSRAAAVDERRVEEQRIVEQLAENDLRAPLTDGERVAAYEQLALFGVTEDQIARKTNQPKARVQTALKVAGSDAAAAAIAQTTLTLEQAAVYVEFDGDAAAIAELDKQAQDSPEQLEHTASRLRRARTRAGNLAALRAELEGAGWEVHEAKSNWEVTFPAGAHPLSHLARVDDTEDRARPVIGKEDVADRPGRVAVIFSNYDDTASERLALRIDENPDLEVRPEFKRANAGGLTDAEKAERKQKRLDKQEMIAATDVRRAWLRDTLLTKPVKHLPAEAAAWVARALWRGIGALRDSMGSTDHLALELLGLTPTYGTMRNPDTGQYGADSQIERLLADTAEAPRHALAKALAETEGVIGNTKADSFGRDTRTAAYLRQLAAWGYPLADVEQRVIAAADANRDKYASDTDTDEVSEDADIDDGPEDES